MTYQPGLEPPISRPIHRLGPPNTRLPPNHTRRTHQPRPGTAHPRQRRVDRTHRLTRRQLPRCAACTRSVTQLVPT
jgi:hypothetical protein